MIRASAVMGCWYQTLSTSSSGMSPDLPQRPPQACTFPYCTSWIGQNSRLTFLINLQALPVFCLVKLKYFLVFSSSPFFGELAACCWRSLSLPRCMFSNSLSFPWPPLNSIFLVIFNSLCCNGFSKPPLCFIEVLLYPTEDFLHLFFLIAISYLGHNAEWNSTSGLFLPPSYGKQESPLPFLKELPKHNGGEWWYLPFWTSPNSRNQRMYLHELFIKYHYSINLELYLLNMSKTLASIGFQ